MTQPHLSLNSSPALDLSSDVLVIGARTAGNETVLYADGDLATVQEQLSVLGISAAPDALTRLPALVGSSASIAVIGLGAGTPTPDTLRQAAGSAVRQLAGTKHVSFGFPLANDGEVQAVLEGAAFGAYSFTEFKSASKDSIKPVVEQVTVHATAADPDALVARATTLARSVRLVKDLVNTPPAELYPESFATIAVDEAHDLPLEVTVWDEDRLAADGFGGILGVGKGSSRLPRLVRLSYAPAGATTHLALVGKGITFDTGGLSLKPPASMVGMKFDMAGAAAVLGTILAAARLEVPVRLTAWLCLAENMPSGTATRPNDVLRIRGGRTVEVLNTDAEGRLVLADGLIAAGEEAPDAIIDVATLTGAQVVALGNRYSGLMGDDSLVDRVRDAAGRAGELVWPMPLPEELRPLLKSDIADIANAKIGNSAGGMLLAGVFLKEFSTPVDPANPAETIPWAHLDIAGPADNSSSPYGFTGPGGTAVMVRTLLTVAEDFSRP